MKKTLTAAAVLVAVLAPAMPASASQDPHGTGQGKALGNCQHSSAGGTHSPIGGTTFNPGNGGLVEMSKQAAEAGLTTCPLMHYAGGGGGGS